MSESEIIPEPAIEPAIAAIRVLELEGKAILDCAQRLKSASTAYAFGRAVNLLHRCLEQKGKIIVTGVGKSGKIAQKIAATLSSTGSLAVYIHPTEGLHGDLGVVRSGDVVLALSYTGNTEEVVRLLPSLKARGVPVIALGGNPLSTLATQCDAWIDGQVESEACPYNLAPTTSTTLALALGDALAITLMKVRKFNSESFAENHPGGSLGKRVNLKVGDLMHSGENVPVLPPDATIEEVIILSTQKKLGAVLIAEGSKLLGVITDGDIRRSLKHREKFFDLKAEDVMTQNPVTTTSEVRAETALDLMENRPSQISILPVVDGMGNWKGILRLHDLARTF